TNDAFDLAVFRVAEFGAEDVVRRNDVLQRSSNHFHRRSAEHIKIKMIAVDPVLQNLVQLLNVFFQANDLAHLIKMLLAYTAAKFRVVQQQVGQLGALLDQIKLGHALGLALKLFGRNTNQLAEHIAGVVKGQCLVEVAGEQKAF